MELPSDPSNALNRLPQGAPAPDPLSEALENLVLRTWLPGRFQLTAPWGIRAATGLGWFYLVSGQTCFIEVDGSDTSVAAAPGDLIVLPQGRGHQLRDSPDSPTIPIESLLEPRHFERRESLVHGGGGAPTSLLGGCFLLNHLERSPLYSALPAFIHVKGDGRQPLLYVDGILCLILHEAASNTPGSQMIINRLVRILLTKAIQSYMAGLPGGNTNWLSALADPSIGWALGLMHAQPDAPWTVASLAERVAMSRSVFSARFSSLVGKPPLEYLSEWRMLKASYLLRTTHAELKEVAASVGYESASALSKAFSRWAGIPPSTYRASMRARNTSASAATMPPQ